MNDWNEYVEKQREADLEKPIQEEKFKPKKPVDFWRMLSGKGMLKPWAQI